MASSLDIENNRRDHDHDTREEEESFSYALQLVGSSALPTSLQCAIELGVFDIIGKAGEGAKLSPAEIAAQLGTNNPNAPTMLDSILRLLACHSVLNCSVVADDNDNNINGSLQLQRLYSLAPVSRFFVTNEDGVSLGPLISLTQDKVFLACWSALIDHSIVCLNNHVVIHGPNTSSSLTITHRSQLKDAILEGGIPFNRVYGMHPFEYPGVDSRFNQVFNTAMYNHTTITIKQILEVYKGFEPIKQLVDVGGGLGVTLKNITSTYPHIKGINFDLPHVIKHAPSYPGVKHVEGDMFVSVPSGDAIFMKWILHNWNDEKCIKLLKNCYKAIPEEGKVIIVDAIFPVMPETSAEVKSISQANVIMMTQNPGGKERTKQEFLALATASGFSGVRFECNVSSSWVMEFFK
ncbi:caffeic acid 3-O-methyltransferase-like [Ziziphus jujuba]|uniref:Caffeic acid 3-O-methyltransferase-like n=1 Tax=Ziziphus jujuba TaxID=326968 RepID=A0ABM4AER4_ZIZJJ|nr:caffeic acid 3-O-methyltransferase-like [Ziziphus jujuba]